MTEQEHYSLRWNNHQNHILRAFDALLQTKSLVDVTLVCAETSIRAHKVVLSACSPFFQNVFAENPCKHPVIVLKDFPGWVVQAVVDFMYRGEISVPQKRLETLIQVGESLQIRGLVEHRVATKELSLGLDETNDDYLDEPTSNESIEHYEDDAPALVKSSASVADGVTAQNGTKHPRLLNSNSFTEISSAVGTVSSAAAAAAAAALAIASSNNTTTITTTTTTIPAQQLSSNSHHSNENPETCTSPMPRRKQARPRRRSGEGGPHDYSSRSTSPAIPSAENSSSETPDLNKEPNECNNTNNSHIDNTRKLANKRCDAIGHNSSLDSDKVVDCTVAAIEQSIIRDKLNANDDDISDNELDDDDEGS